MNNPSARGTGGRARRGLKKEDPFRLRQRPTWLPPPGQPYSATIVVADIQQNKKNKLEILLRKAEDDGVCLVITTGSGIAHAQVNRKYVEDTIHGVHGDVWEKHICGYGVALPRYG